MTPDYSKLDTAALVAAAEALTAGITPGEWEWEKRGNSYVSLEATIGNDDVEDVISNAHRIAVSDANAAFIAAAPALVKALVARLRECEEPEQRVKPKLTFAKFLPDDRVQLKSWPKSKDCEWETGTVLTVCDVHAVVDGGFWVYQVTDGDAMQYTTEDNLEPVTNG